MDEFFIYGFLILVVVAVAASIIWAMFDIFKGTPKNSGTESTKEDTVKNPKHRILERVPKILKWLIIITVAVAIYYFLYPKYYFINQGFIFFRANRITGQVQILRNEEWKNYGR